MLPTRLRQLYSGPFKILAPVIETVAETGSTNSDMLARCGIDAREGLWIRAERQISGRGRMGRIWHGKTGNFYASTCVLLRPDDHPAYSLAFVVGLAVYRTLSPYLYNVALELKWPNDLMVEGKKMCGILLERKNDAVIVGIGINVAYAPEIAERNVTCLHNEGAPGSLTASIIAEELAGYFAASLNSWRSQPLPLLLDKWSAHAHKIGTAIKVSQGQDGWISGHFNGLAADGSLQLQGDDGQTHIIHAGDVEIVRTL